MHSFYKDEGTKGLLEMWMHQVQNMGSSTSSAEKSWTLIEASLDRNAHRNNAKKKSQKIHLNKIVWRKKCAFMSF